MKLNADPTRELFWLLPEVPGGLGVDTVLTPYAERSDKAESFPDVHRLHFEFAGWLGDELITSHPCYLVTAGLASTLQSAGVRGFQLDVAKVTREEQFEAFYPDIQLPDIVWLRPSGRIDIDPESGCVRSQSGDDMMLDHRASLYVTRSCLDLLRSHRLLNCEVISSTSGKFPVRNPFLLT